MFLRLLTALLIPLLLAACNPAESNLVKACRASLKETLLSPLSYQEVGSREDHEPITFDEYVKAGNKRPQQPIKGDPIRHQVFFRFDSANTYGTMVRSTSLCTFETLDGDASAATGDNVKIDGKTLHGHFLDKLLSASKQPL